MSVTNFIPTVWSARLQANLDKALVYGNIVNRDYEGEIREAGDRVKINQIGAVTIGNYDKVTGIGEPEELTSTQKELIIDQEKYFNFKVDSVDAAQANVNLIDLAMQRASYGLGDVMDQYVAGLYTGVDAGNTIGSDGSVTSITAANAYDYLVDLSVLLNEDNVPQQGRFVVLPPWFVGLLRKGDGALFAETKENGAVGRVAGFDVRESNNVPFVVGDGTATFDNHKIMAGHTLAMSFAQQVSSIEGYRPEKSFADAVKGLSVYGAKLVEPKGIAVLSAKKG
jgi:hypothetical protein